MHVTQSYRAYASLASKEYLNMLFYLFQSTISRITVLTLETTFKYKIHVEFALALVNNVGESDTVVHVYDCEIANRSFSNQGLVT